MNHPDSQAQPAFSLTCRGCDAGDECRSETEAIAQGWIEIVPAFDLIEANYLGLCPDCQWSDDGTDHPAGGCTAGNDC